MRATLAILVLAITILFTPFAEAAGTLLVFGDSLSAGYGIRKDAAWPTLLQQRLAEGRFDYSVANASISGETTAGGRSRIDATLAKHKPAIVVLVLGANDGLRGLPLAAMKENLAAMIRSSRNARARVLLVGMRLPPNYGTYADEFHRVFAETATREKAAFVPFLLEGIADQPRFFLADGIHPTAEAQTRLLDNVWGGLRPLLK